MLQNTIIKKAIPLVFVVLVAFLLPLNTAGESGMDEMPAEKELAVSTVKQVGTEGNDLASSGSNVEPATINYA